MGLRLLLWLGAEPGAARAWFALALTYSMHSVIWAVAIALLVRVRFLSSATRHLCWKVALLGTLLTPLVTRVVGDDQPLRSHAPYVQRVGLPSFAPLSVNASLPAVATELSISRAILAEFVVCAAVLGLLRFVAGALWLGHRLKRRAPVTNAALLARFEQLCARMGLRNVQLSECAQARSPLVLGRREICLPCPLPAGLSHTELDTVLAHELAHVERADGVWFPIIGVVQSVFWLNPLNHWLASNVRRSAELACDDRAVELTRDPMGLARALVHVATSAALEPCFANVPTMARSKSAILPRVRRLTAGAFADAGSERGRRRAIVALGLLACGLGTLSVQVALANANAAAAAPKADSSPLAASVPAQLEQTTRLAELATREQRLLAELRATPRPVAAASEAASPSVHVLELNQELRHVRETQAWLEAQLVKDWDSSQRAVPSNHAPR